LNKEDEKKQISDADIEAMINYLTSPDCELLDECNSLDHEDVRDLLKDAEGLQNGITLCDYLNEDNQNFDSVPDITNALPIAKTRKDREIKDIKKFTQESKEKYTKTNLFSTGRR